MEFAGFHLCNNEAYTDNIFIKIIGAVSIVVAVLIGDALDFFGWLIAWIPVIGDILGSTVLGNILDAVAFVILFYWIGFPAFFGIGEFLDILGFVPVIGDLLSFMDVLPWWTFAVAVWLIFQLLRGFNLSNFRLFSPKKKARDENLLRDENPFL